MSLVAIPFNELEQEYLARKSNLDQLKVLLEQTADALKKIEEQIGAIENPELVSKKNTRNGANGNKFSIRTMAIRILKKAPRGEHPLTLAEKILDLGYVTDKPLNKFKNTVAAILYQNKKQFERDSEGYFRLKA